MRGKLGRHGQRNVGIKHGNIRGNFKIGQRVFNAAGVIGNNGKGCYFRSGAAGGRNGYENCLVAQLGMVNGVLMSSKVLSGCS